MSDFRAHSWADLTAEQQDEAVGRLYAKVLEATVEGAIQPLDEKVLSHINLAFARADKMQTPWFAAEYVNDDPIISDWMWDIAGQMAEDAYYIPDDGQQVVRI